MILDIILESPTSEDLALYLSQISQDQDLQAKLKEAKDTQSFAHLIVQSAKEKGYHFDTQEIEALLSNQKVAESTNVSDDFLLASNSSDLYTSNLADSHCANTSTQDCGDYLRRCNIDPYTSNWPDSRCANTSTGDCRDYLERAAQGGSCRGRDPDTSVIHCGTRGGPLCDRP